MSGLTDRHVACVLRAVRAYRDQLHAEIQRLKEQREHGVDVRAVMAEKEAEKACVNEATTLLWQEHADRMRRTL